MIATATDIRTFLALSDEETAELQKQQEKALKKFRSKARLTPAERVMGHGIELELHHRQTGNKDGLAEALGMQGRYLEAAHIAVNPKLAAVLLEKAEAIDSADDDCDCPGFEEIDGLRIPNQYVEGNVISQKHGGVMPAIRCKVCKKLNVRPIFPHLAEQQAARRSSVSNEARQVKATDFFKK